MIRFAVSGEASGTKAGAAAPGSMTSTIGREYRKREPGSNRWTTGDAAARLGLNLHRVRTATPTQIMKITTCELPGLIFTQDVICPLSPDSHSIARGATT